jgi:biopolymer transport protein ExbB/TolQ
LDKISLLSGKECIKPKIQKSVQSCVGVCAVAHSSPITVGDNAMTNITNFKCTSCGAPLKVHKNESTLRCAYCGSEFSSVQNDNEVILQLNQISPSLDRASSELAIKRLKEELAKLDAEEKGKLEDLEIKKKQAISEIEKTKNISLSSPTLEKLKTDLNILREEQDLSLKKGNTRLGSLGILNTSMGLVGGCVTFLVSFVAVFFCSAIAAAFQSSLTADKAFGYIFWTSTIVALVFLVGFTIFALIKQNKLSHEVSSRQRQLEEAIDEQQRSIAIETTKHFSLLNEQMANKKIAIEKEIEVAKTFIKKEISDRQEQLEKHYKRVKI